MYSDPLCDSVAISQNDPEYRIRKPTTMHTQTSNYANLINNFMQTQANSHASANKHLGKCKQIDMHLQMIFQM